MKSTHNAAKGVAASTGNLQHVNRNYVSAGGDSNFWGGAGHAAKADMKPVHAKGDVRETARARGQSCLEDGCDDHVQNDTLEGDMYDENDADCAGGGDACVGEESTTSVCLQSDETLALLAL